MHKTVAAIFDLDGTLFSGHVWRGLVRYHRAHRRNRLLMYGFLATHIPLWYLSKTALISREWIWFAWARRMWWGLRGMSAEEAARVFAWIADEYVMPLIRPDIVAVLREHQARSEQVVLLSGTSEELLTVIGARLGVDIALGTRLEMRDGHYTGRTLEPVCQGEGKAARLRGYLVDRGQDINLGASYAYADSQFDLPVLEMVGNPVPVHPDDALAAVAARRGWHVLRERRRNGREVGARIGEGGRLGAFAD